MIVEPLRTLTCDICGEDFGKTSEAAIAESQILCLKCAEVAEAEDEEDDVDDEEEETEDK